jgi:hypothetical protein
VFGQEIGKTLCACQPSFYTLTLDFGLTCQDETISGPGIVEPPACFTRPDGPEDVDDKVPVTVGSIQIIELDQRLQAVNQQVELGNFSDGSSINFTSIIATGADTLTTTSLPRAMQLLITGENAAGQSLVNTFLLRYSNNCSVYPVLLNDQNNGWIVFVSLIIIFSLPTETSCLHHFFFISVLHSRIKE